MNDLRSAASAPPDPGILEAGIAKMREWLRVTTTAIERWKHYPLFAGFAAAMALPQDAGTFDKIEAKRRFVAALDHARRHHPDDLDLALSVSGETDENGQTIWATGRRVSEAVVAAVYKVQVDFADSRGLTFVGAERIAFELRFDVSTVRRAQAVIDHLQAVGCFDRWRKEDRERWQVGGNWQTGGHRSHVHFLPMLPETEDDGHLPRRSNRTKEHASDGAARPAAPAQTRTPASPRSMITPSGREAAVSAIRAHRELAELDTIADADAIWTASRRKGKTDLLAKGMSELAKKIREGDIDMSKVESFRGLACAFARDVLAWGEGDEERIAAENADLPRRKACTAVLAKATDLAAEAARADQELAAKRRAAEGSGTFVPPPPALLEAMARATAALSIEQPPATATGPPEGRPPAS